MMVMALFAGAGIGYLVGTLLAVYHDRLYTGAPVRGAVRACAAGHAAPLWWSGTPGYLLAGGRCAEGCRLRRPSWYQPLLGAVAGALVASQAADAGEALLMGAFAMILLALVATDFERRLLPNRLMYPALLLAVAFCWAWPGRSATSSLAGGGVAFIGMLVIFLLSPQLGFGDVKLAAMVGLLSGLENTLMALIIGSLAGAGVATFMLIARRAHAKSTMAYGPYLALGALVGMLAAT
jgi:prepilin signal peptidase PulO-like enzyme (type II secretory pathway)